MGNKSDDNFLIRKTACAFGDDALLYESDAMTGSDDAEKVSVSVSGVNVLRLVTDNNGSSTNDYADWALACVTKGATATGVFAENPLRFCGEYMDLETGFIYLRNRYYDPSTGSFLTEDPARDGTNWYIYCYNNPIMLIDPWGLAGELKFGELDQSEFNFGDELSLRRNVEQWGGTVEFNSSTQTATVSFPNGSSGTFTVGKDGTWINSMGNMIVDPANFKKQTGITQVRHKFVKGKKVYLVNFNNTEVSLAWSNQEIGRIRVSGSVKTTSVLDFTDFDKANYNRFGANGESIDLALGDTLDQINPSLGAAYSLSGIGGAFSPPGNIDLNSIDTKLRVYDQSLLYYYITVFLAANGDSVAFVGAVFGGS